MVTSEGLLQIDAYAFVVLWSLWVGGIDYVLPVKAALVLSLFFLLYKAVVDFDIAWKNKGRDLPEVEVSINSLAYEVLFFVGGVIVAALFLLKPITNVNLTSLSWEVKSLVSLSFLWAVWFNLHAIRDILGVKRKGSVPPILPDDEKKNGDDQKK